MRCVPWAELSCAKAVALVLASLERLSYLLVLATVFAPQWDPPDEGRRSDMRIDDCFSAALLLQMVHFNNAPFACIRGQLDYKVGSWPTSLAFLKEPRAMSHLSLLSQGISANSS